MSQEDAMREGPFESEPFDPDDLTPWYTDIEDYQRPQQCEVCGAAVVNTEQHTEFHRLLIELEKK